MQSVPRLQRPVLCVPGGTSQRFGLRPVLRHLSRGDENSVGGVYHIGRRAEFAQQYQARPGNLFTLEFSRTFGSVERNAAEIGLAVEDIKRLTGASQVDVVSDCRGGIDAREYVRQGGSGIRNLIEIAPPNHGLPFVGEIACAVAQTRLRRMLKYPMDSVDSRHAVASFSADWSVGPLHANPLLHDLNSSQNVEREKQALHSITVLGGEGSKALSETLKPGLPVRWLRGDQSVPVWSAFLPHANNFFYSGAGTGHTRLCKYPLVLEKMTEVLQTDGHPNADEHLRTSAPSAGPAMLATVAWGVSIGGRCAALSHTFSGAHMGAGGLISGGIAATYLTAAAISRLAEATRGRRSALNGLAKLAQAAGVGACMAGHPGLPAAALIVGGFVVGALTE